MKKLIILLALLSALLSVFCFADDVDMRLYITKEATETDAQMYHGAKYEPKVGAYLGMYAEADSALHNPMTGNPFYFYSVPRLTHKKHAFYMVYMPYKSVEFNHYKSHYLRAKKSGCAMQVALQPVNGLHEVVDDDYLHRLAEQAKQTEIPIFLRFANEMNATSSTWGADKSLYIKKFRLVAKVMHKEAPNVVMCWSPNDWGHNGFDDAAGWYPGDQYVDWVSDRIATIYNAYADRKPIYLAEGAPVQNVEFETTDVTHSAAKDLKEFYDEIARRYPAVKAVFYWDNEETTGAKRKCYISNNPTMLNAYKASIADDYFLSNVGDNSKVIYSDITVSDCPQIEGRGQEISCFIGNRSLTTHKVRYYINDLYRGESVGSPYDILLNFGPYAGQTVTLAAESYGTNGALIKRVEQQLNIVGENPYHFSGGRR